MIPNHSAFDAARSFCERFGLRIPILLAPMAGVPAPALSAAVSSAGGMGACGVLLMKPESILGWVSDQRTKSNGAFQLNIWISDPPPERNALHEAEVGKFLSRFGPEVPEGAANTKLLDFSAQCDAILEAGPAVVSSIMGIFPQAFVDRAKAKGIAWFATVTTVAEAKLARDAGADVIVAQGAEAGGHRGSFVARNAEKEAVGLMALLPAVLDAVDLPVVATGGIADSRGAAAAFAMGAAAVQIGTGFLRTPEAGIAPVWASALSASNPEETVLSRVFSGRTGRSLKTLYVIAATSQDAPQPAPYPVQRALTQAMRDAATRAGDLNGIQAWAGQSCGLAQAKPASELLRDIWEGTVKRLSG